jgi:hypothetical protein
VLREAFCDQRPSDPRGESGEHHLREYRCQQQRTPLGGGTDAGERDHKHEPEQHWKERPASAQVAGNVMRAVNHTLTRDSAEPIS